MSIKAEIPLQLRRRTHLVDRVIKNLLSNIYPCYYNSSDHFVEGVLDEIIWFLLDMKELQGIDRNDIENYILDYKYDELTDYFNEHCIVLKNDSLQESIRIILREESKIPLQIRRRVDINDFINHFDESLDYASNLYRKNKAKFNAINSFKFVHIVISHLISEVCGRIQNKVCLDYFDELWSFLSDYFKDKIQQRFLEIKFDLKD